MYNVYPPTLLHISPLTHQMLQRDCALAALWKRMRQLVPEQTVLKYVLTLKKKKYSLALFSSCL